MDRLVDTNRHSIRLVQEEEEEDEEECFTNNYNKDIHKSFSFSDGVLVLKITMLEEFSNRDMLDFFAIIYYILNIWLIKMKALYGLLN